MDALEICNKLRSEASGVATSGIPLDVFPHGLQNEKINELKKISRDGKS